MSFIKRISTSLYSQLDEIVGEIENHDALIKAAITEQKKKLAAAKMQLQKIQASQQNVEQKIQELNSKAKQWQERAIKSAKDDEKQALSCIQRHEDTLAQIDRLNQSRKSYRETAEKMATDIGACEQELRTMIQKHEMMKARQSSVDARTTFNEHRDNSLEELANSFDRWELKLSQNEIHFDVDESIDELERSYIDEENTERLKNKLDQLLKEDREN